MENSGDSGRDSTRDSGELRGELRNSGNSDHPFLRTQGGTQGAPLLGGWAGSAGRWVDKGMGLRVLHPQIEARCTAQFRLLKCTEMCCMGAVRVESVVRSECLAIDRCVVEI